MAALNVGPGGLQPPGPIATRCEASRPQLSNSVAAPATSLPEATWNLDAALQAKTLVVTVSTPKGPARLTGGAAKALLALKSAGKRGLSPPEALSWTAQLGSTIRDLRDAKIGVGKVIGDRRDRVPVRYVLTCQPDIAIVRLVPRGFVL